MLVLTRKIGQQIVLPGCSVTIDVVCVTKSQVRLGIEAPFDVPVYRREILDRIHRQREHQSQGKAELNSQVTAMPREPESPNATGDPPPDLDRMSGQLGCAPYERSRPPAFHENRWRPDCHVVLSALRASIGTDGCQRSPRHLTLPSASQGGV